MKDNDGIGTTGLTACDQGAISELSAERSMDMIAHHHKTTSVHRSRGSWESHHTALVHALEAHAAAEGVHGLVELIVIRIAAVAPCRRLIRIPTRHQCQRATLPPQAAAAETTGRQLSSLLPLLRPLGPSSC